MNEMTQQEFDVRRNGRSVVPYKFNLIRELLHVMPKGKMEVISDDPKEQCIANQMTILLNLMEDEVI